MSKYTAVFNEWVRTNQILQKEYEFIPFWNFLKGASVKTLLEIGCYKGGTAKAYTDIGIRVVAVDNEPYPEALDLAKQLGPEKLTIITGDSHDIKTFDKARALLPEYDVLFIDADHSEEAVRLDYAMYNGLVKRGGLIAFHDIVSSPENDHAGIFVGNLWKDIVASGKHTMEFICAPICSCGIGVVFN